MLSNRLNNLKSGLKKSDTELDDIELGAICSQCLLPVVFALLLLVVPYVLDKWAI